MLLLLHASHTYSSRSLRILDKPPPPFTENEYLWTISLWDLPSSLGDKFQLVLCHENWRSVAASGQFVID
jgi:hypothetical protein